MKALHLWMAGAALAAIALTGCQAATSKPAAEPEPTPPPEPAPGLAGTWGWSSAPFEEDGETFTEHMLLTFVGDRSIEAWEKRNAVGERVEDWFHLGGWSATDTTIEKRWYDTGNDEHGSVMKRYYWGDAEHKLLYVEFWQSDDPESHYSRLTRVPDALPDLDGTWTFFNMYNNLHWRVTFDGKTVSVAWRPEDEVLYNIATGTGALDPDTYFLDLTGITFVPKEDVSAIEQFDEAGVGRLAVAPSHNGRLRVSPFWDESPIVDRRVAEGDAPVPYGHYWMHLKRQPAEE